MTSLLMLAGDGAIVWAKLTGWHHLRWPPDLVVWTVVAVVAALAFYVMRGQARHEEGKRRCGR